MVRGGLIYSTERLYSCYGEARIIIRGGSINILGGLVQGTERLDSVHWNIGSLAHQLSASPAYQHTGSGSLASWMTGSPAQ